MIPEPDLIPRDALRDVSVGISVSDSSDLARLGLSRRHANLVIGEVTRATLLAGGTLVYGGRLSPSGFTQQMMNEVRRFGVSRPSLTVCLPFPEHASLSAAELDEVDRQLGAWGRLVVLDVDGSPLSWRDRRSSEERQLSDEESVGAYSALRQYLASISEARILVGGQLRDFKGAIPGVIEEAMVAIGRGQPLYLAAGFGGATAAVARQLGAGPFDWLPDGIPEGADDAVVLGALQELDILVATTGWDVTSDGLTTEQRSILCASHRPGEIASLSVIGLARRFSRNGD